MPLAAVEEPIDDFTSVFESLSELGDKPDPVSLSEPDVPTLVEKSPAETPPVEGDPPPAEKPSAEIPPVEDETPTVEPVPTEHTGPDDVTLAHFAKIARESAAQEAAVQEAARIAAQRQQPGTPPPLYTRDEQTLIDGYHKEWGEVARMEALKRRGEYTQLVDHVQRQVASRYDTVINNLLQHVQNLATRTQYGDLANEIPDYDDIRDKAIEWAGKQPAWLQRSFAHVINEGTPEEIKGFIDLYKQSTGAISTPVSKPVTELPAAAKKAAAALAPVSSKRTSVITSDDPSDFEGAFAKFAEKGDF